MFKYNTININLNTCDVIKLGLIKKIPHTLLSRTGARLAKEISKDGTKVENISQACRPSNLKEMFSTLSFQTASNLKQVLTRPPGLCEGDWKKILNTFFFCLFRVTIIILL